MGSVLPAITDTFTTIDGRAYDLADGTGIRDTNFGTSGNPEPGFSGNKGVGTGPDGREGTGDELQLPDYSRPEFEIDVNDQGNGVEFAAGNGSMRRVAIFNVAAGDDAILFSAGAGGLATENFIGARADGTDPDVTLAGSRIAGTGIHVGTGAADVTDNFVAWIEDSGIHIENASVVAGNDVYRAGLATENDDAITLEGSTGQAITVRRNRVDFSNAYGIESWQAPGPFTIEDNTIANTGKLNVASGEIGGIRVFGDNSIVRQNIVTGAQGAGIVVAYRSNSGISSKQNRISKNAVYGNGGLGIDLDHLTLAGNPNGDGVSLNNGGTAATTQNIEIDFPVLDLAEITGPNLTLTGFARPGTVIELFIAAVDPTGFGEGQTYLVTMTESGTGAGGDDGFADLDATVGSYSGPINGLNQGMDAAASLFQFVIPLASMPGVGVGTTLTATARDSLNNTSEFSGGVAVRAASADLSLIKTVDNAAPQAGDTIIFTADGEQCRTECGHRAWWLTISCRRGTPIKATTVVVLTSRYRKLDGGNFTAKSEQDAKHYSDGQRDRTLRKYCGSHRPRIHRTRTRRRPTESRLKMITRAIRRL